MYDALILAGGSARRLGGADKPAVDVGGRTLLEHVLVAVPDATRVVIVGPRRPLPAAYAADVIWCVEDPPGGGPVAAISAGLSHTAADVVLVLAADLPSVRPAVPVLRAALGTGRVDVALLADPGGRDNHLAAAWRRDALATALAAVGEPAGVPMRALLQAAEVARVADVQAWGRDCDTWPDIDAARAQLPTSVPPSVDRRDTGRLLRE